MLEINPSLGKQGSKPWTNSIDIGLNFQTLVAN